MTKQEAYNSIIKNDNFITLPEELEALAKEDRLRPLYIKCSCVAFTCAAQFAQKLMDYVSKDETDYVRSIELVTKSNRKDLTY